MQGLHPVDITVIVLYLVGITGLGIWMARRVKHVSDFFMPRRFGKGMMIMHAFGTGTASDQAVTVASATFRGGLSGIWYQWLWLFVTPFYWLIAPIFAASARLPRRMSTNCVSIKAYLFCSRWWEWPTCASRSV